MAKTRRTRTQWQQLLEQWQQSHVTLATFCAQQGISHGSFYKWRKKLQGSDKLITSPMKESPWQTIEIGQESHPSDHWQMELSLPGGAVLRIRQD